MNTHADKAAEANSTSIANGSATRQRHGRAASRLSDNRPEAAALLKMQDLAEKSPRVSQLRALQKLADNSPRVSQLRALQKLADNSPQAKRAAQFLALADATAHGIGQHAQDSLENDELIQAKPQPNEPGRQPRPNNTGLPDKLKAGIEALSGLSLDHLRVHYNSAQPAQLNALAYAQGSDIHLAPGQERHLPHEAWHVVQQAQGRVRPTMQLKDGVPVNDDAGLEREADVMGRRAISAGNAHSNRSTLQIPAENGDPKSLSLDRQMQSNAADLNHSSSPIGITQLRLCTVDPQTGPIELTAIKGKDLYMWNQDQKDGEEPKNEIGDTNLFKDWAGAELGTNTFHRGHAYGKQFGGAGGSENVAWWTSTAEQEWTKFEDKIRGDNNGGNAAQWEPGEGETGHYQVYRTLLPKMAIKDKFTTSLLSACQWGLDEKSAAFQDLITNTLAGNQDMIDKADRARCEALAGVNAAINNFLGIINIDKAAALIINNMRITYTINTPGADKGNERKNIDATVNNTHTLDHFGLVNNDEKVWNSLSSFQGMFDKGNMKLRTPLTKRLPLPEVPPDVRNLFQTEADAEAEMTGENKDKIYNLKVREWKNRQTTFLGPKEGGWGKV
jgi:hypothetical protein